MVNLASVDLNLLVAFEALMTERNVTHAAKRVGLTQPAMSNALKRLRVLFDDPLLERSPVGMRPTHAALTMIGPIRRSLLEIQRTMSTGDGFDIAESERTFRIAGTDYSERVFIAPMMSKLRAAAPHVDVRTTPAPGAVPVRELESGRLDLAIHVYGDVPTGARRKVLVSEEMVCLVWDRHPRINKRLTLQQFLEFPHILVTPDGETESGPVDTALATMGEKRRVFLTVPHFLAAPFALFGTDAILTLPRQIGLGFAKFGPARLLPCPVKVPGPKVSMVWHERDDDDPANQWLRALLIGIAGKLRRA